MNDPFGVSKAMPTKAIKTLAFKKPKISGPEMGAKAFTTPGQRTHESMLKLGSKGKKGFLRKMT